MATNDLFRNVKKCASSALIDTTRAAGQLSDEDLAFHRSSNPSIISSLERQSSRLLKLAQKLTSSSASGPEVTAPHLLDIDSVDDNWKGLVDVFDDLLEKADACLDEYTGAVRRRSPNREGTLKKAVLPTAKPRPNRAYRTQIIPKPQLLFNTLPTNDELTPFKPLLNSKPHAKVPLEKSLVLSPSSDGTLQYKHPYETEITESRYPAEVYAKADPICHLPFENSQAIMVDSLESLMSMVEELKLAHEIAVDLEHHDEHSYIGLVCLMQISTRGKDWIIDTLKPWRLELQVLNVVFTNPHILKIFHGAYMDMIWLQRDFGLYVVGLFDTYHASRSLGYPRNSLAYLLKRFANFDAAKQYQMADWRIRPLPDEMFNYARSDTHFLLYIYDNMRNQLIDKSDLSSADGDLISVVMKNSKAESLQRYERPIYDVDHGVGNMGWHTLLCRTPAQLNREQFAVFRAVHQWRDTIARQEDESVQTILSKQALYKIAREIPTDMASLLGFSHPISGILQKRKRELLGVIKQAKIDGVRGPDMKQYIGVVQPDNVQRNTPSTKARQVSSIAGNMTAGAFRTEHSRFWGPVALEEIPSRKGEALPGFGSLYLALPLPQLMAQDDQAPKYETVAGIAMTPIESDTKLERQPAMKSNSRKDVIAVNQSRTSKKRQAPAAQDLQQKLSPSVISLQADGSNDNGDGNTVQSVAYTANQRAGFDPTEKFKLGKNGVQGSERPPISEGAATTELTDAEAFDYANAPSILHVKRSSNDRPGIRGSEVENPYIKSLNTRTGLHRMRKDGGDNMSLTYSG